MFVVRGIMKIRPVDSNVQYVGVAGLFNFQMDGLVAPVVSPDGMQTGVSGCVRTRYSVSGIWRTSHEDQAVHVSRG
jgi:hypothetical protein